MNVPSRRIAAARLAAAVAVLLAAGSSGAARADVTPPAGGTILADLKYPTGPQYIDMAPWMTQTGWDIKEIVFTYYSKTDTLDVDIKTTGIAGDADGLGHPGGSDPLLTAAGGSNPANLGGRDSITVAFSAANANHTMGAGLAVAGVPQYKPAGAPEDGFRLAQYLSGTSLQNSYGNSLTTATGTLLYSPSASQPDFEFQIQNFSRLYGLTPTNGFYFSAYAGSPDDVVVGEDNIGPTYIGPFSAQPQIINPTPAGNFTPPPPPPATPNPQIFHPVPEPASFALVGLGGLGALAWGRRRRARA